MLDKFLPNGKIIRSKWNYVSKLNEQNKRDDQNYLLVRGVKLDRLVEMEMNKSAGREKANINALAPTEEEAKSQVDETGDTPEFTTNLNVAENFGKRGAVCIVEIEGKYLTLGSRVESGWVAAHDAPLDIKGWYISNKLDYHFER